MDRLREVSIVAGQGKARGYAFLGAWAWSCVKREQNMSGFIKTGNPTHVPKKRRKGW